MLPLRTSPAPEPALAVLLTLLIRDRTSSSLATLLLIRVLGRGFGELGKGGCFATTFAGRFATFGDNDPLATAAAAAIASAPGFGGGKKDFIFEGGTSTGPGSAAALATELSGASAIGDTMLARDAATDPPPLHLSHPPWSL